MKAREQIGKCTKCGKVKPINAFHKDKRSKFGIRPECKDCDAKRPSRVLKAIKWRLILDKHYTNITADLTLEQISEIPYKCFFCSKPIESGAALHRFDHKGDYTISNVVFVHKVCHARFGGHTTAKNPNKGFTSESARKARQAQLNKSR